MRSWETTLAACIAATGQALHDVSGVPPWVNATGKIMAVIGTALLGVLAVSQRCVDKQTGDTAIFVKQQNENKPNPPRTS